MDKASLTLGYLVGRQIAGQRRAVEKTPVAYLYGKDKVRLPPLPEWDDKTFQYVYLSYTEDGAGVYAIYAFTAPKEISIMSININSFTHIQVQVWMRLNTFPRWIGSQCHN